MHGTIAVDSQIDKGTTVTLTFPNAEPAGQGWLS
jgi:signal transduction histidine kinase